MDDTLADDPELASWCAARPPHVTADPLWRLDAYRHASFVSALARTDADLIAASALHINVAAQLLSSAGSLAANIAEGYGRPTSADRIRFISFALGSLRECSTWYEAAEGTLDEATLNARQERLARLRRILLGLLRRLRTKSPRPIDRW